LERQVLVAEFGPVLALPVKTGRGFMRPEMDENGHIDWGAFGSVDFDRYTGGFDKARYKADKVKEQLKDVLILFSIVNDRIATEAKYLVLKYLRMGIIELEHIVNQDMAALARLYLRARRMRQEIDGLREASERRREHRAAALWRRW
jgi:CO dehydrogenase/acetyl-CoA synthase beta subunit